MKSQVVTYVTCKGGKESKEREKFNIAYVYASSYNVYIFDIYMRSLRILWWIKGSSEILSFEL